MASSPSATAELAARTHVIRDPGVTGWRLRAFTIAALGYVYIVAVGIGAVLLVPTGLGLAAAYSTHPVWPVPFLARIAAMLLFAAGLSIAWSTVRGFLLPRTRIDGIPLEPDAAPGLRRTIAELATQLQVRAPKRIVVTHDGSSWLSIQTHESGRRAVGIYIGIATLLTLPPDQLAATLAHELAHMRTRDARLTCFIERAVERWCAYAVRFSERRKFGALPLAIVARTFIAQLSAPLARLSRTDELGADTEAARCTSAESLVRALERLAIETIRAEEVLWPELEREALEGRAIPDNYCDRWLDHLKRTDSSNRRMGWHRLALHQQPAETDSHPTLAERILALDAVPEPSIAVNENSTSLLQEDWPVIRKRVDRAWKEANEETWSIAAERGNGLRQQLSAAEKSRSIVATLKRALALEELGDEQAATALLEPLVARETAFDEARYHLARLLLARGDESGIRHMDAVIESDEAYRVAGVCHAMDFMIREGRFEEADSYQCVIDASADLIAEAERERSELTDDDEFAAHDLDPTHVARIRGLLESVTQIECAYLVQKKVRYEMGDRLYVLAVDAPWALWKNSLDDVALRDLLLEKLVLPGDTEVAFLGGWESWIRPHVEGVANACIFTRA